MGRRSESSGRRCARENEKEEEEPPTNHYVDPVRGTDSSSAHGNSFAKECLHASKECVVQPGRRLRF